MEGVTFSPLTNTVLPGTTFNISGYTEVTTVVRSLAGLEIFSGDSGTSMVKFRSGSRVLWPFSEISMGDMVMSAESTSATEGPNQSESATSRRATPPEMLRDWFISGRKIWSPSLP